MKKLICLFVFTMGVIFESHAQTSAAPGQMAPDTSSYPYWVQMMKDPSANFFQTQRAFNLYWQHRKITKGCGWKVFKRWEYMMQSRVSSTGEKPKPDATISAYKNFSKNITSTNGNWTSLGPSLIPSPGPAGYEGLGRINTVGFYPGYPERIFIGSPSGGMWQSMDGGNSWVSHTDSLPTLGVSAILVDYSDPSRIFIGTGDRDAGDAPGLGIYKSLNGGSTWAPSNTGMGNHIVGRIIQHPVNPMIILAATDGGVYRTTDGGASWTQQKSGSFMDITFKPNDPDVVYAAASGDFYRSTDNGITFTKITSGLTGGQRGAVAVSSANPSIVYFLVTGSDNGFQGLYRSTNSGLNFTVQSTTPNILDWTCDGSTTGGQGWYDLAVAADPVNANIVYVGGVDVWKSMDGGVTWNINSHWYGGCGVPAVHADCHFLFFSPVDGNLYASNDGGVYSTNDGGITWNDHTTGLTIGQIYKLGQAQKQKDHVINGFQDNGTYTYTSAGWEATGGGDGMECAIDYADDAYSYYTIYYGDIYRMYNNSSENHIAGNGINGITESGAWVTPFVLHRADPQTMFIGYKNIWRSNNIRSSTPTWKQISDNLAGSNSTDMAVVENSPVNTNLLYAARSDNKLFRSDNCMDESPVWIDLTSHLPVSEAITDLEASPSDQSTVFMTTDNGVYKSADKGLTWTNLSQNLPVIHKNSIVCYRNDLEGLYVSTDAGVYYKNQSMTSWLPFSNGLPLNGKVTELEIFYDSIQPVNDVIRGCTFGRGLWSSDLYHAAPDANFIANKTDIPAGCPDGFTDLSTGVPTSWLWTFTGATPSTSSVKNPENIIYSTPGTYPVKLKVWNSSGTDSLVKTNYINVIQGALPIVDFSSDKTVSCLGDPVSFFDASQNCPLSWLWEFAPNTVTFLNGTTANSQNPVVTFNQNGKYTVRLTATNAAGSNSLTRQDYFLQGGYDLPFSEDFESGITQKNWTILNPDGNKTWDTITVAGTLPGTKAVWINFFNYAMTSDRRDQLISPPMNFTGFTSVALNFQHAYAQRAALKDSLIVKISADCGTTWNRILAAGPDGTPNVFVTHSPMLTAFFPVSSDDWCDSPYGAACYSLDLSPWAGQTSIKIEFESYNSHGNNLFIDNIHVSGTVGIPDQAVVNSGIYLFPNPSSGIFTINVPEISAGTEVVVYNLTGQTIYQNSYAPFPATHLLRLDLTGYEKGFYYCRITNGDKTKVEKLLIR